MPRVMNMPKIGVNMTDAKIVAWVVKEGDSVKEGDHLLDAETDKAVQEIYATVSGIFAKALVKVGDDVLCQTPIAVFNEPDERFDAAFTNGNEDFVDQQNTIPIEEIKPVATNQIQQTYTSITTAMNRIKISPLAKKLAKEMGVPIAKLQPGRVGGRIVKADVLAYCANAPATMAQDNIKMRTTIPYTGIRKIIGERMTESRNSKPAVGLALHVNVEKIIEWRNKLKSEGRLVSYNDILVLIVARALKEQPFINSRLVESEIELMSEINIGVAVDTQKGLAVPVIKNADRKTLLEISEDLRAMVEAAKTGKASVQDMTGGTFTISNLGMFEIEQFTPIINPPECAILGIGAFVKEPVAGMNDGIEIRTRMQLTLAFDHRMVDGAPAAKFLQRVKHLIEWPLELIS